MCLVQELPGEEPAATIARRVRATRLYEGLKTFCARNSVEFAVNGRRRSRVYFHDYDAEFKVFENSAVPRDFRDVPFGPNMTTATLLFDLADPNAPGAWAHGPSMEERLLELSEAAKVEAS